MKKLVLAMALALSVFLSLSMWQPAFGAEAGDGGDSAQQIEELQKQLEELQSTVNQLTEENESLKEQLEGAGEQETEAPAPEVPENVANADTNTEYTDKSTVLLVQQTLNNLGYNCGSADGVAGSKTKEQINAYEKDHGLTVNGAVTDQLLESLGIADKVAEEAKKEAEKKDYSSDFSYKQLARNPDSYIGEKVKFSGKVLQGTLQQVCCIFTLDWSFAAIQHQTERLLHFGRVIMIGWRNGCVQHFFQSILLLTVYNGKDGNHIILPGDLCGMPLQKLPQPCSGSIRPQTL